MSETGSGREEAATSMSRPGISWRTVALPVEHGGWSFLIEPLVLGLVVAPSAAGGWLAVSAVAAFLARQPLKLMALDRKRGARYPRTELAEQFFAGYRTSICMNKAHSCNGSGTAGARPLR